jgi:hypothetical protein
VTGGIAYCRPDAHSYNENVSTAHHRVSAFERAWNTSNDAERLELLADACSPEAVFVSPYGSSTGLDTFSRGIGEFRHQFPAAVVTFGTVEDHFGFIRVGWRTSWRDGRDDLVGEDLARTAPDGRLEFVASFNGTAAIPDPA